MRKRCREPGGATPKAPCGRDDDPPAAPGEVESRCPYDPKGCETNREIYGTDGTLKSAIRNHFLPVVLYRHLSGSPRQTQLQVAGLEQQAGVLDHLRVAAEHDARVLGAQLQPGGTLQLAAFQQRGDA